MARREERAERSFGLRSGRYRESDGEFKDGPPPSDYDPSADRFRGEDGRFKSGSKDLAMGTDFDAPHEDAMHQPPDAPGRQSPAPSFGGVDLDSLILDESAEDDILEDLKL